MKVGFIFAFNVPLKRYKISERPANFWNASDIQFQKKKVNNYSISFGGQFAGMRTRELAEFLFMGSLHNLPGVSLYILTKKNYPKMLDFSMDLWYHVDT